MPEDNCQKIKLLKIMELLRQESDEQHPIPTSEFCRRLIAMNISSERRTLAKDIAMLNKQGYEIMFTQRGREKAYYVEDRSFSVPELKILIDAVQAASFITKKKTDELIDKLADLGGSHRAEILKSNVVCFNTRKHSNESIFYNVGYLEEALQKKQKASFCYFDLDEKGERVYRKEKERYIVEPMALVFHEDNYYLMCYSPKYKDIVNYRVDRMESVAVEEEPVSEEALLQEADVGKYTEQVFKMYNGPKEDVVLQFDQSLLGVIYDKFGEDTKVIRSSDTSLVATVKVQISPTFWGWLFQFGGKMKLLSPESVIEEYNKCLKDVFNISERKTADRD
jgi:predicted DNA-binding transcriptional regulator YafY